MRRYAGYIVIFVLGFVACMLVLRNVAGLGGIGQTQAQRNAIAVLDQPPAQVPAPDSPIIRAAAKIEPAVVNIDTLVTGRARAYDFFGNEISRPYALEGKGSGVIITGDGYIVTNNHVIEGANIIKVTLPSGKQFDGRPIGTDPDADLAVVKIEGRDLPAARLGDSSMLKVGEEVIAIGYPLGLGTTVTHGIISATDRRDLEISEGHKLRLALQTDAPINRGNSGGALANLYGQLIGINTAIVSENRGGSIGIGFAIPINAARGVVKDIIAHGRSQVETAAKPFVGIQFSPLNPQEAAQLNLPPGQGVKVDGVVPLTAAAQAGISQGDIIVSVDSRPITSPNDVLRYVALKKVGDKLALQLVRGDGSRQRIDLVLGRRPDGLTR